MTQNSGIIIKSVRVRNFRSLRELEINLGSVTLLVGENNSGKTSFFEALNAAFGSGRRTIYADDVFLAADEQKPPLEWAVSVEALILPVNENGKECAVFADFWRDLWGGGVQQDQAKNDAEFVAVRTLWKWSIGKGEYAQERKFLKGWGNLQNPSADNESGNLTVKQMEPWALQVIDARRDIIDEFQRRGSFWNRLVTDLGLPDGDVKTIEQTLTELNNQIVEGSDVLSHLQEHLNRLYRTISAEKAGVEISPVPRHLRDFAAGVGVNFKTQSAASFPLGRHGMGTRSLAAVLTFGAFAEWRMKLAQKETAAGRVHPVLGLEEPEAHLHPQGQRAMVRQMKELPGQKIVSTHSPYIAAQADLLSLRYFRKVGAETRIEGLNPGDLTPEEVHKIGWMVLSTRGEMLFARALVFFEGETEAQMLPVFAEEYLGNNPAALGLSLINVGGDGNYGPFLTLAHRLVIPWFIFSDGEPNAVVKLTAALNRINVTLALNPVNVCVLPGGQDIESNLLAEGYLAQIEAALNKMNSDQNGAPHADFIRDYMDRMKDQKVKPNQLPRDYFDQYGQETAGARERACLHYLKTEKTSYGEPVAREILTVHAPDPNRFPTKIRELLEAIKNLVSPPSAPTLAAPIQNELTNPQP